jgi:hypothetical protein
MTKDELRAAAAAPDEDALRAAGWGTVLEAFRSWWVIPGGGRFLVTDLEPYIVLLGAVPIVELDAALERLASESKWLPKPSELLGAVVAGRRSIEEDEAGKPKRGRRARRDQEPAALEAVKVLLEGGEPVCECVPRPPSVTLDELGVLRCATCRGIEQGQAYDVEDLYWPPEPGAELLDLPAEARKLLAGGAEPSAFLRAVADRTPR